MPPPWPAAFVGAELDNCAVTRHPADRPSALAPADSRGAEVDADVDAPDPEAIATMHTPELIGGDVTHHLPVLRQIWWSQRGLGYRYPAQHGIILIDGGKL